MRSVEQFIYCFSQNFIQFGMPAIMVGHVLLITRKKEDKNTKAQSYYIKTRVEQKEKKNHCIEFTCLTNVNYDTMT